MNKTYLSFLFASAVCLSAGCAKGQNGSYFSGKYLDLLTVGHDVSEKHWLVSYPGIGVCERTLLSFDRDAGTAVFVEGATNCFNPGKYGKTYFVADTNSVFRVCDYLTGKNTPNEVTGTTSFPDSTNPSTGGCNGKAWGKFTPTDSSFSLVGNFTDNYGGSQIYTNTLWTSSYGTPCSYAVVFYDNVNGFFIYQQQADAGCTSSNNYKFGKVFWTVDSASKLYYCELMYGQSSYLTVANSTTKPGYSNPATAGCSGFGWTQLIR